MASDTAYKRRRGSAWWAVLLAFTNTLVFVRPAVAFLEPCKRSAVPPTFSPFRQALSGSSVALGRLDSLSPPRPPITPFLSAPKGGIGDEAVEEFRFRDKDFLERAKRWVIIVDDEEAIRLAVGDYLFEWGYQVTACADADALLEVCATSKSDEDLPAVPDVIVSDIRMPGKDGLELLSLLRADERLARVPVIMLTAKSLTKDRIEGYKAGADAYLTKPFNPEELLAIVDNAILRRGQMTGSKGKLIDLKADMSDIKAILRRNGQKVVRATDVYLTPAEREVLELLCKGFSNGEIASERGVNVLGVNRMIQTLYLKTRKRTRTELVRWAIKTGHVPARRT